MNIALIGPSGAGKGTYAHVLAPKFNLQHVSTGDFLRQSRENGSALGLLAKKYMRAGEFVPDEVIDAIIEECLLKMNPDQGILFDGFPRTGYQANFLEKDFTKSGRQLDAVIYLKVRDDEIQRRLAGRLICRRCQLPHHVDFTDFNICSQPGCGGELFRRDDDVGDIPAARLSIYHRETAPLIEYFQSHGKLVIIDAERPVDVVTQAMENKIANIMAAHFVTADSADAKKLLTAQTGGRSVANKAIPTIQTGLNLVFLGAPGSGKGTQAKMLCEALNIVQVSTGDLFRLHIRQKTDLGKLAKFYIDRGELVPNNITEQMVKSRLQKNDTLNGIVLDGFPRTLVQATALTEMMAEMGKKISGVLYFEVDDEAVVPRIAGRISCKKCQTPFHNLFNPFQTCPQNECNGEYLYQRLDDTPETVRKRLHTFYQQTEPLIEFYHRSGLLHRVDANTGVQEITRNLLQIAETLNS